MKTFILYTLISIAAAGRCEKMRTHPDFQNVAELSLIESHIALIGQVKKKKYISWKTKDVLRGSEQIKGHKKIELTKNDVKGCGLDTAGKSKLLFSLQNIDGELILTTSPIKLDKKSMKSLKKLANHKKVKPAMKKCNENCHYPRVQSAVWKPVKPVVKDGVKMQISFAVKHISDAFSSDFTKYVKPVYVIKLPNDSTQCNEKSKKPVIKARKATQLQVKISSFDQHCHVGEYTLQLYDGDQYFNRSVTVTFGTETNSPTCKATEKSILAKSVHKLTQGSREICNECAGNDGTCCQKKNTNEVRCVCSRERKGATCASLRGVIDPTQASVPQESHFTPAVLVASLVVCFLVLASVLIYCICKQSEKTYLRQHRRLSRPERKKQHEEALSQAKLLESNNRNESLLRQESATPPPSSIQQANGYSHEAYYPTMRPDRQNSYLSTPTKSTPTAPDRRPSRNASRNNYQTNSSTINSESTILSPSQHNGPVIRTRNHQKLANNSDPEDIVDDL